MVAEKPRIVILGAGMAGLTASHRLIGVKESFEFGGDRIEKGAHLDSWDL